jgi:hypothetical protein
MLDSNLHIMPSSRALACCPAASSLVCEGEFIASDNTLHLFDIFFHHQKGLSTTDCRCLPFFSLDTTVKSRYGMLKAVTEEISNACTPATIEIVTKEFLMCTRENVADALAASSKMCADGLVFTPCDIPVDMLWARVLKWKPTHTVDFKVVHDDRGDTTHLQVGSMEPVSLLQQTIVQYSTKPKYIHVTFPHHGSRSPRINECADGSPVPNNCVVECEWDAAGAAWRAVKLRRDKARSVLRKHTGAVFPHGVQHASLSQRRDQEQAADFTPGAACQECTRHRLRERW